MRHIFAAPPFAVFSVIRLLTTVWATQILVCVKPPNNCCGLPKSQHIVKYKLCQCTGLVAGLYGFKPSYIYARLHNIRYCNGQPVCFLSYRRPRTLFALPEKNSLTKLLKTTAKKLLRKKEWRTRYGTVFLMK